MSTFHKALTNNSFPSVDAYLIISDLFYNVVPSKIIEPLTRFVDRFELTSDSLLSFLREKGYGVAFTNDFSSRSRQSNAPFNEARINYLTTAIDSYVDVKIYNDFQEEGDFINLSSFSLIPAERKISISNGNIYSRKFYFKHPAYLPLFFSPWTLYTLVRYKSYPSFIIPKPKTKINRYEYLFAISCIDYIDLTSRSAFTIFPPSRGLIELILIGILSFRSNPLYYSLPELSLSFLRRQQSKFDQFIDSSSMFIPKISSFNLWLVVDIAFRILRIPYIMRYHDSYDIFLSNNFIPITRHARYVYANYLLRSSIDTATIFFFEKRSSMKDPTMQRFILTPDISLDDPFCNLDRNRYENRDNIPLSILLERNQHRFRLVTNADLTSSVLRASVALPALYNAWMLDVYTISYSRGFTYLLASAALQLSAAIISAESETLINSLLHAEIDKRFAMKIMRYRNDRKYRIILSAGYNVSDFTNRYYMNLGQELRSLIPVIDKFNIIPTEIIYLYNELRINPNVKYMSLYSLLNTRFLNTLFSPIVNNEWRTAGIDYTTSPDNISGFIDHLLSRDSDSLHAISSNYTSAAIVYRTMLIAHGKSLSAEYKEDRTILSLKSMIVHAFVFRLVSNYYLGVWNSLLSFIPNLELCIDFNRRKNIVGIKSVSYTFNLRNIYYGAALHSIYTSAVLNHIPYTERDLIASVENIVVDLFHPVDHINIQTPISLYARNNRTEMEYLTPDKTKNSSDPAEMQYHIKQIDNMIIIKKYIPTIRSFLVVLSSGIRFSLRVDTKVRKGLFNFYICSPEHEFINSKLVSLALPSEFGLIMSSPKSFISIALGCNISTLLMLASVGYSFDIHFRHSFLSELEWKSCTRQKAHYSFDRIKNLQKILMYEILSIDLHYRSFCLSIKPLYIVHSLQKSKSVIHTIFSVLLSCRIWNRVRNKSSSILVNDRNLRYVI